MAAMALALAPVVFSPTVAGAQTDDVEFEELLGQEELDALVDEFVCPTLETMTVHEVTARASTSDVTVTCTYTAEDLSANTTVSVTWQPPGVEDAYICQRISSTTDDEQYTNIRGTVRADGVAAQGDFNYYRDRVDLPASAFEAAAAQLAAQATGPNRVRRRSTAAKRWARWRSRSRPLLTCPAAAGSGT